MTSYNDLALRFDLRQYARQLTLPMKFMNCSCLFKKVDRFEILAWIDLFFSEFKKAQFSYAKFIFIYGRF